MTKQATTPKSRKPATVAKVPAPTTIAAQLQAAAPTDTAPAAATPKNRATPTITLVIAKEFKPRTNNVGENPTGKWAQQSNWDALVKAIQEHGGKITYAEAVQAVADSAKGTYEATANARGFVQGRVRNGHLVAAA
jgi:hypothetical protein